MNYTTCMEAEWTEKFIKKPLTVIRLRWLLRTAYTRTASASLAAGFTTAPAWKILTGYSTARFTGQIWIPWPKEKVGRLFQGVITAMYPDREENMIFGEYISETVDGKIHGNICAIMEDGQMGIIEDSIPRNSGNDRLSFVAAQGDDI